MPESKQIKERVLLTAFSSSDIVIETHELDIHKYWDDSHPVIDEENYRAKRKIKKLLGRMYNSSGEEYNRWIILYSDNGSFLANVSIQTDGFVCVDGTIPSKA